MEYCDLVPGLGFKLIRGAQFRPIMNFIGEQHYRTGTPRGEVIACYVNPASSLCPSDWRSSRSAWPFAGALVLGRGCAYAAPVGRYDLIKQHDIDLDLSQLNRGEVVNRLGLAMINRVAVHPDMKSAGVGTALAMVARKYAPKLFAGAKFVEVMTTRRLKDAEAIAGGRYVGGDFLLSAGYSVASTVTGRKSGNGGRTAMLYYFAEARF